MASTDPKKTPAAQNVAPAAGTINAPKIQLGDEFEKVATGADGFWRCDEGDEVFGTILGTSEKLETVLVELLSPAVAHKGIKGIKGEDQEMFLAEKGQVLHLNLHYNVMPVLMNAPMGTRLYIKCTGEAPIGAGKTLKSFDVRLPKDIKKMVPGIGASVKPRPTIDQLRAATQAAPAVTEGSEQPAAVQS